MSSRFPKKPNAEEMSNREKRKMYERMIEASRCVERGMCHGCPPDFGRKSRRIATSRLASLDQEIARSEAQRDRPDLMGDGCA